MKLAIFTALLTFLAFHLVPEQADKADTKQDTTQQAPKAAPIAQAPPAGQNSPVEESSTNGKANKPGLLQRMWNHVVDNWGLLLVAIVGIWVAIRTLGHMQESSEKQLRAYVVMEVGSIVNVADPLPVPGLMQTDARRIFQNGPRAVVQIKNAGQTPAFRVEHWGGMSFREFPLTSELPGRVEGTGMISNSILGPGIISTKTFGIGPILTDAEVAQLRAMTSAIYVYGEIRYEDAFKRKHFTRYRLMHNEASGPLGVSTELTFTDNCNEAD